METEKTQVWSCGGGTQSAAIAALIVRGALPKPDIAAIVDTGRERSWTWDYLRDTLAPALASVGVTVEVVDKGAYASGDLYAGNGDLRLPMFTNDGRKDGKMPAFCSNEWKRRVLQRWLRQRGVEACEVWIGITLEEMHRVRAQQERWYKERYPLLFDVKPPMRRSDCIALVKAMGWPDPIRSACWCCPNASNREWKEMRDERPSDFAAAVQLERDVRASDPGVFLHGSCVPLDTVDLDSQLDIFADGGSCASGMCWV